MEKVVSPLGKAAQNSAAAVVKTSSSIWQASAAKPMSEKMLDDLSDFKKSMLGKSGLCSSCEKFPIDRIMRDGESGPEVIIQVPLEIALYHYKWCRLCRYLPRQLYQPENDPFKHPQIKNYLRKEHQKMAFKQWVDVDSKLTDKNWPFGFGKVKHEGPFH